MVTVVPPSPPDNGVELLRHGIDDAVGHNRRMGVVSARLVRDALFAIGDPLRYVSKFVRDALHCK